jgi:hypothetical protein
MMERVRSRREREMREDGGSGELIDSVVSCVSVPIVSFVSHRSESEEGRSIDLKSKSKSSAKRNPRGREKEKEKVVSRREQEGEKERVVAISPCLSFPYCNLTGGVEGSSAGVGRKDGGSPPDQPTPP